MVELDLSISCRRCPKCKQWIEYDEYIHFNRHNTSPYYPHYSISKLNKLWLSEYVKILCCDCRELLMLTLLFAKLCRVICEKYVKG